MEQTASLRFEENRGTLAVTADGMFREHAPYVARVALRLLGRQDEVDDVVQEVFLAAQLGVGAVRDPSAMRSWLATIAVRKARSRLRLRWLRSALGRDEPVDYEDLTGPGADPEERALLVQIYAVLDRLPANHRLAWTLRVVEGEQLEAVAALCGCSLATAKRWIQSAHEVIKREVSHG